MRQADEGSKINVGIKQWEVDRYVLGILRTCLSFACISNTENALFPSNLIVNAHWMIEPALDAVYKPTS